MKARENDFDESFMWDFPRIPKGLDKSKPLETDPTKRSWKLQKTRHKVKEYLHILKIPFKK